MPIRRTVLLPLVCVILLAPVRPASAQTPIDPSFRADLEKLVEVTEVKQMGPQLVSVITGQVADSIKRANPKMPDRAIDITKEVMTTEFGKAFADPNGLLEQIIQIYARHFTQDEIRALTAFYSTDVGKKSVATMPLVFQEASTAGQQWSQAQMPHIMEVLQTRLRAEGYVK